MVDVKSQRNDGDQFISPVCAVGKRGDTFAAARHASSSVGQQALSRRSLSPKRSSSNLNVICERYLLSINVATCVLSI